MKSSTTSPSPSCDLDHGSQAEVKGGSARVEYDLMYALTQSQLDAANAELTQLKAQVRHTGGETPPTAALSPAAVHTLHT
jgi:hypothetical protein